MFRRLLPAALTVCALATAVHADTIRLKDGTTLVGEIQSADKARDRIEIRVKVGTSTATLTVKYSDVAELKLGVDAPAPKPAAPRPKAAPKPAAPGTRVRPGRAGKTTATTPMALLKKRVVVLVDASGSMAIGKRWAQAIARVRREVAGLRDGTLFDVMLFHDQLVPLFTTNNSLTKNGKSAARTATRLRAAEPDLRRGTNLYRALHKVARRTMGRLVIVTDGVLTRGGPDGTRLALKTIEAARARGVQVDLYAAQDGTYQATTVEDKAAARRLLKRYADAGRGTFGALPTLTGPKEVLPTGFKPLAGTADGTKAPWRVEVISTRRYRDFHHWEAQYRVVTGVVPLRFRVRVWDPRVNRGEFLDVWEYGGAVWIDVHTPSGKVLNLRLHRSGDKQTLVTDREIRIVGPKDENLKRGALHDKRYAYVQGFPTDEVRIVYRRGSERFTIRRTTGGAGRAEPPRRPRSPTLEPETPVVDARTD